jgi:hypothetical protein
VVPEHIVNLDPIDVTPTPVRARLGGLHDGVAGRVEVFRRMLVLGRVATADVPARQTQPELYPLVAASQALFATLGVGHNRPDLLDVRTGVPCHGSFSLGRRSESTAALRVGPLASRRYLKA